MTEKFVKNLYLIKDNWNSKIHIFLKIIYDLINIKLKKMQFFIVNIH